MARPDKAYLEKQTARRPEKKKPSIGEGATDSRMAKISFKNYLRQIEEDLLDEEDDLYEAERKLPETLDEVQELYDAFLDQNQDLIDAAREKSTPEDGAEFFMNELKGWLERERGFNASELDEWLESEMGQEMYDMFWNGLT